MATGLEIIVGTYEEFLLGYRVRPSRSVSCNQQRNKKLFLIGMFTKFAGHEEI